MKVHNLNLTKLKKRLKSSEVFENYDLKNMTTFRVGGKAKYFLKLCTIEDFVKAMIYLQDIHAKIFVLGNGSNIVFSDNGYDGVVIKLCGDFERIQETHDDIQVGAGVMISSVISYACEHGLGGIEKAIGVPASMGGATCMNLGCFGFEMSNIISFVVAYDLTKQKIIYLNNSDCEFGYRKSIFSNKNYIILRIGLKLTPCKKDVIKNTMLETLKKRNTTQPKGFSAGCVFKRVDGIVVSKLLDEMGAKEMSKGDAQVSQKHANFILNLGNAKSTEIFELIEELKQKFFEKYKIKLDCEIEFVGE